MKKNKVIYWIATSLVILMAGLGSIGDFLKIEPIVESTQGIGFPLYILPFLGAMKVLGVLAILVPALVRFKEAAYAGLVFYFVGAIYCHIAVGDGADKVAGPAFILLAVIVSYVFDRKVHHSVPTHSL